jgi:hypothetical protein
MTLAIVFSIGIARKSQSGMLDFKAVFYASRCLIHHTDPYQPAAILREYRFDGQVFPTNPKLLQAFLHAMPVCINLPSSLVLLIPFAYFPWSVAHVLWFVLASELLTLAGFLAWDLARDYSPGVSVFLICGVLVNSVILLASGNLAGIAVPLCVIAVWCFFRKRFELSGVLALAISLSLKPHDAGLVWLFLLLAGSAYRKRAFQSLIMTILLCLPAILYVSHTAPNWSHELHANIVTSSMRGGINDPGPSSLNTTGVGTIIALQSLMSLFRDDPHFYNPATYAICGVILAAFAVRTLRLRVSQRSLWLAVATIVPLTLLITYHRSYDARLLLLAIPACAMLWKEGGRTRVAALALTAASIAATGGITRTLWVIAVNRVHPLASIWSGKLITILLTFPAPLLLLALCLFYLREYLRPSPTSQSSKGHDESTDNYTTVGDLDGAASEAHRDSELADLVSR